MKNIKPFIAGVLTGAILFGGIVSAAAATGDLKVSAILSNTIKMKLYGQDFNPRESNGTYIKPIGYNGRNYLPIRSLAEALHIPVLWENNTIWIGGKIESVAVKDTKLYEDESRTILTTDTAVLTTPSKIYKWGVTNDKPLNSVYFRGIFKPNNQYAHFIASIYLADDVKKPYVIDFKKEDRDGIVLKSITINPGETVDVDIDIATVYNLFMDSQAGTVSKIIIGEPTFKNEAQVLETELK